MEKITLGHPLSKSEDLVKQNLETLKSLFPTIVKEGKFDFEELKALLGEEVETNEEYYRFSWAGKSMAKREANKASTATLRPNKKESKDWNNAGNIFIEGDNLEVLKLLQKSYADQIKTIYIDPPYNTGKDFVYKDNYNDNLSNYLEITGQTDEEGKRISTNTESDGRYHSNWLNMLYPRLKLARNLLKEDGAIFISIDDNEVHNLRKICDEIFGEENFISNIIWEKKFSPQNDAKYFSDNHDHILMYAKVKAAFKINLLQRSEENNSRYSNPDNDPRGAWTSSDCTVRTYSKSYDYPIVTPSGKEINPTNGRCWFTSKERFQELIVDNRIWFGVSGSNTPRLKKFLSEVQDGIVPLTIWKHTEVGHNQEAKQELIKLFDGLATFDTPKPTRLIKRILQLSTNHNDSHIVLDFFAGSGTTADALFQLNSEDNGNRKFICVQLPEPMPESGDPYKAGLHTISEITKERIRRAGLTIEKDFATDVEKLAIDLGFKAFRLDSSNIQAWDGSPDNLDQNLFSAANNIKEGRTENDVLYEILLKYGLDLAVAIEEKVIAGKQVFNIGGGALFICLADEITTAVADGIGKWKEKLQPAICQVILKDTGFTDVEKSNSVQILRRYGITEVNTI